MVDFSSRGTSQSGGDRNPANRSEEADPPASAATGGNPEETTGRSTIVDPALLEAEAAVSKDSGSITLLGVESPKTDRDKTTAPGREVHLSIDVPRAAGILPLEQGKAVASQLLHAPTPSRSAASAEAATVPAQTAAVSVATETTPVKRAAAPASDDPETLAHRRHFRLTMGLWTGLAFDLGVTMVGIAHHRARQTVSEREAIGRLPEDRQPAKRQDVDPVARKREAGRRALDFPDGLGGPLIPKGAEGHNPFPSGDLPAGTPLFAGRGDETNRDNDRPPPGRTEPIRSSDGPASVEEGAHRGRSPQTPAAAGVPRTARQRVAQPTQVTDPPAGQPPSQMTPSKRATPPALRPPAAPQASDDPDRVLRPGEP